MSNNVFNDLTRNAAMVCPITNRDRGLPIEVPLTGRTRTSCFVMCEQAKILDVSRREAEFIERAPDDVLAEAVDILIGFVELS